MKNRLPFSLFVCLSIFTSLIQARDFRVNFIPNGIKFSCSNCHIDPAGGGPRNKFGQAVEARVTPGGNEKFWDATLAKLDSDGDGFTNGQELQDPNGTWRPGDLNPGTYSLVTLPGDPSSKPLSADIASLQMPVTYKLEQNYPNPFNPSTVISYQLPAYSHVTLKVFDILGNEITTLVNEYQNSGIHNATFNTANLSLSSGTYFYRIQSNDPSEGSGRSFIDTKKFVLIK